MINLTLFQNVIETENFLPGQTIFKEGDTGQAMYIVREGEIEIKRNGIVFDTIGPGVTLGEMGLIDHKPRTADAVAKTSCKLVLLNERQFQFLVQQVPDFALEVLRIIVDRLRKERET